VSSLPVLNAAGGWTFTIQMPAWSTFSITLPTGAQTTTMLAPTDDTTVRAGANAGTNYGTATTLSVGTSITDVHDTTSATFVRFDASAYRTASSAILELTVASVATSGPALLSVIAVSSTTWAEAALTWNSASFALNSTLSGVVSSVVNNFVRFDTGAALAGHITVNPTDLNVVKRVDVTDSVAAGGVVGYLIVRRMRNSLYTGNYAPAGGIPADALNAGQTVAFYSKEATTAAARPALRIIRNGAPSSAPRAAPVDAPVVRTHAIDDDYTSATDTDLSDVDGVYTPMSIASLHTASGEDGQCSSWLSPYVDHYAIISGTVIAVFSASSDLTGFVIQDDTVPFSGVLVVLSAEQAGSLALGTGFLPASGAVVRVEGVVGSLLGNVVLEQVSAVTLITPGVALPQPVNIQTSELYAGCTLKGEQYRNMVVRLANMQFTIDPFDLTDVEYRAALANLSVHVGTEKGTPNQLGELYMDDGTGPIQVDDRLFDVVAELGWSTSADADCGVALGVVADEVIAVAVFDDSQSKVAYELGDPPTLELNIISVSGTQIQACPPAPAAASPPAPPAQTAAVAATVTLSGINATTYDAAAVEAVLAARLGASATFTVDAAFPVLGAAFSYNVASGGDAGSLVGATKTALARAFAAFSAPVLPVNIALTPAGTATVSRRSLQQVVPATRVSYGLSVYGARSPAAAASVTSALTGMTSTSGSRGLAAKLTVGGGMTGVAAVAVTAQPSVSAVLTVSVTYLQSVMGGSAASAVASALDADALAAALSASGVATTGVRSTNVDRESSELTLREKKLIGGIIGGFFGLVLLAGVVACAVRRSSATHAARRSSTAQAPPAKTVDDPEADVQATETRNKRLSDAAGIDVNNDEA
jgi:hypothetical protein